jgi:hypothetical protein
MLGKMTIQASHHSLLRLTPTAIYPLLLERIHLCASFVRKLFEIEKLRRQDCMETPGIGRPCFSDMLELSCKRSGVRVRKHTLAPELVSPMSTAVKSRKGRKRKKVKKIKMLGGSIKLCVFLCSHGVAACSIAWASSATWPILPPSVSPTAQALGVSLPPILSVCRYGHDASLEVRSL